MDIFITLYQILYSCDLKDFLSCAAIKIEQIEE